MELDVLGVKICVFVFFCTLCYKLWRTHGLPFFTEERTITTNAQSSMSDALANLQQKLVAQQAQVKRRDAHLEHVKETFLLWQKKIVLRLQQEREADSLRLKAYASYTATKREAVLKNEQSKEELEKILCQTRAELITLYTPKAGTQALERIISKLDAQ